MNTPISDEKLRELLVHEIEISRATLLKNADIPSHVTIAFPSMIADQFNGVVVVLEVPGELKERTDSFSALGHMVRTTMEPQLGGEMVCAVFVFDAWWHSEPLHNDASNMFLGSSIKRNCIALFAMTLDGRKDGYILPYDKTDDGSVQIISDDEEYLNPGFFGKPDIKGKSNHIQATSPLMEAFLRGYHHGPDTPGNVVMARLA